MRRVLFGSSLLFLGCGGGQHAQTTPAPEGPPATPVEVVQEFMQAVSDSNLSRMSELWGTSRGSASVTRDPVDYQRRVMIMQSYLRNGGFRVLPGREEPSGARIVNVELARPGCVKSVPFTLISFRGGWLINAIELDAAGTPAKPCGVTRP